MIIEEDKEITMKKYNIYAGLGGGFGGARLVAEAEEFEDEISASHYAYECAVEEYQSYEGYHGIVSYGDILDCPEDYGLEEGFTEEDVDEIYQEEVESWITYYVKEVK